MKEPIKWERVNNDYVGSPRYVCHFIDFLTPQDEQKAEELAAKKGTNYLSEQYDIVLKKAKQLGGRKFDNKQFAGGIVFRTYVPKDIEKRFNKLNETQP